MKNIIERYCQLKQEIKELESQLTETTHEALAYEFPRGKYEGKTIQEVILKDEQYCRWWIRELPINKTIEVLKFPMTIRLSAEARVNAWRYAEEQEREKKRAEWCKKHGESYEIDYAVRHNINMRDWGM